jgi:hypothetical protein
VKETVLLAGAFFLLAPQVLGGEVYRSPTWAATPTHAQPVTTPVTRALPQPVSVVVVLPPPPPQAPEPLSVNLHSPDGQVRRFAVEGGREAIVTRRVVIHPGESLTIRFGPAK